jgi:uncharacterized protein YndB with AHSA1/START domain
MPMVQSSSAQAAPADQVLEINRIFDAPRELVFRLWSKPEFIVRWWGPEGLYLSTCEMDFRVGGRWRYTMHSVGGDDYPINGIYREIEAPSRLCFTYCPEEQGDFETLVEIDFIDLGERTEMRFRQSPFPSVPLRDAHNWGWNGSLGLLERYLGEVMATGDPLASAPRPDGIAPDIVAARKTLAAGGDVPEQPGLKDL